MHRLLSLLLFGLLALDGHAANHLLTAPAPSGVELKHDFEVMARVPGGEWQRLDTYMFRVDEVKNAKHTMRETSVAKFEFDGEMEIRIKSLAKESGPTRCAPRRMPSPPSVTATGGNSGLQSEVIMNDLFD